MWVATGIAFAPVYLLWSVVAIIASVLNLYFFALLILVISSWLAPYSANPALELVREVTEPICAPVRRVIPAVGGLDFSIIVIFIGLILSLPKVLCVTKLSPSGRIGYIKVL